MTGAALHAARAGARRRCRPGQAGGGAGHDRGRARSLPDVLTVESALGPELEPAVADALDWADALVVGPGLGREPARGAFLQAVLARRPVPTVVDADALTPFRGKRRDAVVFTPHLGEFRALFGDQLADAAANDRWAAAAKAAQKVRGTVLLKGVPTVIADPWAGARCGERQSRTRDRRVGGPARRVHRCDFLARGGAPPEAAALGAHALGRAAEQGARQWTARSLRPADVLAALPDIWRAWAETKASGPPVMTQLESPETE